ncbi:MAG: serine/threonine protein kinase, partial [Dehalococcoidia bacterium]|nr:serine/threonine protein kinase [Dehalococcoidia bacterium]
MIGTLVGPYRIVELLGKGGVGEVYRAYHQETSRDVALKILAQAPDAQARARFAREAEALRGLRHPGIIEIVSVGEFEGRPYYTMPFVRVMSLADLIHQRTQVDRGRFSQDEVLRVVVDVARALRYAHGRGVVHRDVKPGNILVDPQFRPILCDFGLARSAAAETVTRHGTMVGTPRYMAPEQLQG